MQLRRGRETVIEAGDPLAPVTVVVPSNFAGLAALAGIQLLWGDFRQ